METREFTVQHAAEALNAEGAYVWRSGGGIMLGRIDLGDTTGGAEPPYALISSAAEMLGGDAPGWMVGLYVTYDDENAPMLWVGNDRDLKALMPTIRTWAVSAGRRESSRVTANGHDVWLQVGELDSGDEFVQVCAGAGTQLAGEEPGVYYPEDAS